MTLATALKRIEAERKRNERAAVQRQKQLNRLLKERAKLSAIEQARLEVEAHENALEVVLTVHRDCSPAYDWWEHLSALPACNLSTSDPEDIVAENGEIERLRALAARVLAGDVAAYGQALQDISPLAELSTLGSSLNFHFQDAKIAECEIWVNGRNAIPSEVKTLTSTGKLSVKAMPIGRLHEVYQDYVCGCVLRVAREVFALLPPVKAVIITAKLNEVSSTTGKEEELVVLSVILPRETLESLDFQRLDPSDSMENFLHRGDVRASRKTGGFNRVDAFRAEDVPSNRTSGADLSELLQAATELRAEFDLLRGHFEIVQRNAQNQMPPG